MSTRQYIGARYVPKFADPIEWSNQVSYEALTIVQYLGGTYTSKKAVPAGTLPTNTEYWVQTANFNSQMQELMQEINKRVLKKNVIIIGDSYALKRSGFSKSYPEWCQVYTDLDNDHFRYKGRAGAGFINGLFLSNITDVADNMSSAEKELVTDVYFLGGWNDVDDEYTQLQFNTAAASVKTYCNSNFENAKVHVGFFAGSKINFNTRLFTVTLAWYKGLVASGWDFCQNFEHIMHFMEFFDTSDYGHPTEAGAKEGAKLLAGIINNGYSSFEYKTQVSKDKWANNDYWSINASDAGFNIQLSTENEITRIELLSSGKLVFQPLSGGVVTPRNLICGGAWNIYLAYLPDKDIVGSASNIIFNTTATIYYDTDKKVVVPVLLRFNEGVLEMNISITSDANPAVNVTLANMYRIEIMNCVATCDTRFV